MQYFTISNGIQNKLFDFYENSNESADGMFKAIKDSTNFYKLSFDQVSALSADNTNANYGIHHSLYTNMTKLNCYKKIGNYLFVTLFNSLLRDLNRK